MLKHLRGRVLCATLLGLFTGCAMAASPGSREEPIVVAVTVSYSNGVSREIRSQRVMAGINAHIEKTNAGGGINGRLIRIVEVDDHGRADQYQQGLRSAIKGQGAIALLGCTGDASCDLSAQVAAETGVPLVGPLSGLSALSRAKNPFVFRVRASYSREADSIGAQLAQLACTKIVLLVDGSGEREADVLMQRTLEQRGMKVHVLRVDVSTKAGATDLMTRLGSGAYHAAVMSLSLATVERIVDLDLSEREEWPRVLMTMSNGNLAGIVPHFKNRVLGFSQIVPNPELGALPLSRDLDQDAGKYTSPHAITLDGMEGYVAARLLVEGLRRAGPRVTPGRLTEAFVSQDIWMLNGFKLSFAKNRETGSDWVEIGLRSRTGTLVR